MKSRVIAALDFSSKAEVEEFLDKIPNLEFVKVGLELYSAEGPEIIKYLKTRGLKVFLDVKLHDIPNTINRTVGILCNHGVDMITLHAGGGIEMMKAARKATEDYLHKPKLLAVTKLTSISDQILKNQLGIDQTLKSTVQKYAANALEAKMDGVIASVREAAAIQDRFGDDLLIVTPGIRLMKLVGDDQVRIGTPIQAFRSGADYIVVGRAISYSPDPQAVFNEIVRSIQ